MNHLRGSFQRLSVVLVLAIALSGCHLLPFGDGAAEGTDESASQSPITDATPLPTAPSGNLETPDASAVTDPALPSPTIEIPPPLN